MLGIRSSFPTAFQGYFNPLILFSESGRGEPPGILSEKEMTLQEEER